MDFLRDALHRNFYSRLSRWRDSRAIGFTRELGSEGWALRMGSYAYASGMCDRRFWSVASHAAKPMGGVRARDRAGAEQDATSLYDAERFDDAEQVLSGFMEQTTDRVVEVAVALTRSI
jgi:hypothetical protein